jgi:hypothetical protein
MGTLYAGVWRAGTDSQTVVIDLDWNTFQSKWQQLSGQNMRLYDFKSYVKNNQRVYAGVYRAGSDGHYLWVGVDWTSFQAKWTELSNQGLRLTNLQTWVDGTTRKYAASRRTSTERFGTLPAYGGRGPTATTCGSAWIGRRSPRSGRSWRAGTRPTRLRRYVEGGVRFAGVWRAGTDGHYSGGCR